MQSKTPGWKSATLVALVAIVMLASSSSALEPAFELLWTLKTDPRAKPGMANKEDGITVECVEFSADGKLIAAGFGGAKQVVVFRFKDASVVRQIPMPCYIEAVAWTTDGRYLLAGGRDKGLLHVFSTTDWAKVTTMSAQENASIEYIDTFGDLVAVGGEDGHIRLFRISTVR